VTVDELIKELQKLRQIHGGQIQVYILEAGDTPTVVDTVYYEHDRPDFPVIIMQHF
jgi:hypothetical protein